MERPAMVATGVPQLDTIMRGGIAERSLVLLCGQLRSGKTVLASPRFLHNLSAKLDMMAGSMLLTMQLAPGGELERSELAAIDSRARTPGF